MKQSELPKPVGRSEHEGPPGPKWRAEFYRKFSRLENEFGKGETYSPRARALILHGVVPEWVFRGNLVAETAELVERCQKAALALERLYTEIFGEPGRQDTDERSR